MIAWLRNVVCVDYISMKLFSIFKKPWFRGFWSSVCSGEAWLESEIDPKGTVRCDTPIIVFSVSLSLL